MDLAQLKQFNPKKGEKYIFIENNRAVAVLMCYDDYESVKRENPGNPGLLRERPLETKERTIPNPFKAPELRGEAGMEPGEEDLTVEDLPF